MNYPLFPLLSPIGLHVNNLGILSTLYYYLILTRPLALSQSSILLQNPHLFRSLDIVLQNLHLSFMVIYVPYIGVFHLHYQTILFLENRRYYILYGILLFCVSSYTFTILKFILTVSTLIFFRFI